MQCKKSCRYGSEASVSVHINHQNGEKNGCSRNLSEWHDFWPGLSIFVTADLLGFSGTILSWVYSDWWWKTKKISSEQQFCRQKCLVDERGQWRMARLVQADRKAMVTQITSLYKCGEKKSISECTTSQTLKWMGYKSRRPRQGSTSVSQPIRQMRIL